MQKQETDWSKYSNESIDFILSQSEKTMNETMVAYRENINKSYAAIAIYSTLLSYSIANIIANYNNKNFVYLLILSFGMVLSIITILTNLTPKKMSFVGSKKSFLCQDYYENYVTKETQLNEYKIQTIETYDEAINGNDRIIRCQVCLFNISLYVFLVTLLFVFFLFLILL